MKSIFLIGDSISLYYHKYLKELLKDEVKYYRKGNEDEIESALNNPNNPYGANGGDSNLVFKYMNQMIDDNKKYDLILVNCGLHDIRIDRKSLKRQTDKLQYKINIENILRLGQKMSSRFIWINTTPIRDKIHNKRKEGYIRYNKDVIEYNKIADDVMRENNIEIIDLYNFTKSIQIKDAYSDHVHFKEEISKDQAKFIYDNIKKYL